MGQLGVQQVRGALDGWVTVGAAARRLGRSERRIRQLADRGALESMRLANGWRLIATASVDAYLRDPHPSGRPRKVAL